MQLRCAQGGTAHGRSVGLRKERGMGLRRGAAAAALERRMRLRWGATRDCAGAQRLTAQGRSSEPRGGASFRRAGALRFAGGASCGCTCTRCLTEQEGSVGLRRGAVRGRAGVRLAAA